MDHDNGVSNPSGNRRFPDVLRAYASRRGVLAGGLAAAATGILAPAAGLAGERNGRGGRPYRPRGRNLIGFEPVPVEAGNGPEVTISNDYEYQVLIPWGDPLEPGGPRYDGDPNSRPSAKDQADMIGIGHDGMWFFPFRKNRRETSRAGMLCINHEFRAGPHEARRRRNRRG